MSWITGLASIGKVFSGVIDTVGQFQQGQSASSAEQFNASVSRANARAVRISADLDIQRQRRQAESFKSSQRAGYAKAGVKFEGSPMDVMIDTAAQLEMDSETYAGWGDDDTYVVNWVMKELGLSYPVVK